MVRFLKIITPCTGIDHSNNFSFVKYHLVEFGDICLGEYASSGFLTICVRFTYPMLIIEEFITFWSLAECFIMNDAKKFLLHQNMTKVRNGSKMNIFIKKVRIFNVFIKYFKFWLIIHKCFFYFFLNILKIQT